MFYFRERLTFTTGPTFFPYCPLDRAGFLKVTGPVTSVTSYTWIAMGPEYFFNVLSGYFFVGHFVTVVFCWSFFRCMLLLFIILFLLFQSYCTFFCNFLSYASVLWLFFLLSSLSAFLFSFCTISLDNDA